MLTRHVLARLLLALVAVAFTLPIGLAMPAQASHGGHDDVRAHGRCGGAVHWRLRARHDDGRFEVEGEIDGNHAGQTWHWSFQHNGSPSAKGTRRTAGASGSFEVERRMSDLAGQDHFVFRATHGRTVCRGTIAS
jgi:hypothetical protein